MVLKLITSHDIPDFDRVYAAYNENRTFLEYATIETSLPSLIILAFPMGITKSSRRTYSGTSKLYPYKFSFYKKATGFPFLIAALRRPLQSSASYGLIVIKPGIFE